MNYTLTITEEHVEQLKKILVHPLGHERAAYLLCGLSETKREKRLIVTAIQEVDTEHIVSSSSTHISIASGSFVRAFKKADNEKKSLMLVHSHPNGLVDFSQQDNNEEKKLFKTAYMRAPGGLHGSVVISGKDTFKIIGRVWTKRGKSFTFKRIRIVGKRIYFFDYDRRGSRLHTPPWTDRQVRAFGKEVQVWLKKMHMGVVGTGGTGSAIVEQLIRLGVGEITVIDEQTLENTNVTRIYGSRMSDVGKPKVDLMKRLGDEIGLKTKINPIKGSICDENIAKQLRDCDMIFSCTDDASGRMVMNRLAIWYLIPVIDMAIKITSNEGIIKDITGRITSLRPGSACLLCRGGSDFQQLLSDESLHRTNPKEYKKLLKQKYADELPGRDPSIVMLTSDIASRALIIFMQMLTNFMGSDWTATEIKERYHETDVELRVRKNSKIGNENCFCTNKNKWGKGDERNFLGRLW